jgi:alpha/beta superfamily hydrolase
MPLLKAEEFVLIPSSDGVVLESRIFKPSSEQLQQQQQHQSLSSHSHHSKNSQVCVILTHPYGRLGGNLHNNVVEACFELFSSLGFMTVRFNFRGVGHSTGRGTFRGTGEMEDVMSVYKFVKNRENLRPRYVLLVGYSYGSMATCAVFQDIPDCIGIVSISYPAGVLWALTLGNSSKFLEGLKAKPSNIHKLFIFGE